MYYKNRSNRTVVSALGFPEPEANCLKKGHECWKKGFNSPTPA